LNGHGNQLKPAIANEQQKFQAKQAELQRQKLQELVRQQKGNQDIDTSFIKSEPASDDVSVKNSLELSVLNFFLIHRKKKM
jgi:adenylosuccinate lyase